MALPIADRLGGRLPHAPLVLAGAAAALAVVVRLVSVLRGGGIQGLGNYDDGVYYAAGTALAHGLLPYRDFLFLQPPGIVLTLAPFGAFGGLVGDPTGFAAARLAWMVLGGVNTFLVARILRPVGLFESGLGAVLYALSYPAVYIEWTPLLEGPAQTCVLGAILLLTRGDDAALSARTCVLAGALLGVSATFKIWGVVAVAAVVGWLLVRRRWRCAGQVGLGSVLAATVVCLPFFVAAPGAMWRMVVVYQLGRAEAAVSSAARLAAITGLGLHRPRIETLTPLLIAAIALAVVLTVLAATVRRVRVAVVLSVALSGLLLWSPSFFLHYPGLVTGPLAIVLAAGAGVAIRRASAWRRPAGIAVAVVLGLAMLVEVYPLKGLTLGRPFPGKSLGEQVATTPGCVTSDDPAALILTDVLSRNLDRGCPFVADPGGYSYQLAHARGSWLPRRRDAGWQQIYLTYLRSGALTLPFRYDESGALSPQTQLTIDRWPRRGQVGRYVVREPQPPS